MVRKIFKWQTCAIGLDKFCIPSKTQTEALKEKWKLEKENKAHKIATGRNFFTKIVVKKR